MIIFLTIIWIILAECIGRLEAYHFFVVGKMLEDGERQDEHPKFTMERILISIPFVIAMHTGGWITWLNGLCLPFLFVMVHDGAYYAYMNKLKPGSYPKEYWDFSLTSIAWADRKKLTTAPLRIAYFVIGVAGLILINYYG